MAYAFRLTGGDGSSSENAIELISDDEDAPKGSLQIHGPTPKLALTPVSKSEPATVYHKHRRSYMKLDGTKLLYAQFRGFGSPPNVLGATGDIFLDITPSAYRVFAKYDTWKEWKGIMKGYVNRKPPTGTASYAHLSRPEDDAVVLFCSCNDVVWMRSSVIAAQRCVRFRQHGQDTVTAGEMMARTGKLAREIARLHAQSRAGGGDIVINGAREAERKDNIFSASRAIPQSKPSPVKFPSLALSMTGPSSEDVEMDILDKRQESGVSRRCSHPRRSDRKPAVTKSAAADGFEASKSDSINLRPRGKYLKEDEKKDREKIKRLEVELKQQQAAIRKAKRELREKSKVTSSSVKRKAEEVRKMEAAKQRKQKIAKLQKIIKKNYENHGKMLKGLKKKTRRGT